MDSLRLISIALALSYVSGAPSICKDPRDLHIVYKELVDKMGGYLFPSFKETEPPQKRKDRLEPKGKCPMTTEGETRDRSTCPWYNVDVSDPELFPSNWTEAACKCSDCGTDVTFGCEPVMTSAMFLKRSKCANGEYEYEKIDAEIQTGCVCTKNRVGMKPGKK